MRSRKKFEFDYIDKARIDAGFFVDEAIEKLGISRSTWYRWKKENQCPEWALILMELLSGKLDYLGWKNWKIELGILYRADLNPKYYNRHPSDLMISVFCDCPAHQRIRARMHPTPVGKLPSSEPNHKIRGQMEGAENDKDLVDSGKSSSRAGFFVTHNEGNDHLGMEYFRIGG